MMINIQYLYRYVELKKFYKFIEKMLEEVEYYKNIIKNHFNKEIIMTENDKILFKQSKNVIFVL